MENNQRQTFSNIILTPPVFITSNPIYMCKVCLTQIKFKKKKANCYNCKLKNLTTNQVILITGF